MFIDISKFKKVLKAAHKGLGIEIAHYPNGVILIAGGGWIIEVHESDMTNKFRAALVELIGNLPTEGVQLKYKEDQETEVIDLAETDGTMLMDQFVKGRKVQDTRVMIQWYEKCYSIFQTKDTYEPFLVNRELQNLVNPKKIDAKKDELPPEEPVLYHNLVIYNNDTMQLAITRSAIHNDGELDFMRLIDKLNMRWPYEV